MTSYLRRGLGAGALGGVASALSLLLLGERSIRDALALEAHGGDGERFSRATQVVGGSLGLVVTGVLIGVVFSIVFAAVRHHSRLKGDFARSLGLAAVCFLTVVVVPFAKYPANPPSVGDPATITRRTFAYLSLLSLSAIATAAVWTWSRRLRAWGWSDPARVTVLATAYLVVMGAAMAVLPPGPDPSGAPAALIWRFRIASLAGWAFLWGVLGLAFGWWSAKTEAGQDTAALARA